MNGKIPADAFGFYYALGPERSYGAVADEYGVSKQAVGKVATKEGWRERVESIDREARQKVDQQIAETVEEMGSRHLRMLRVIQGKALETLKAAPLATAMEAVRAMDMTIRQERLIRGEPTDREELGIAEVVRRETSRWLRDDDSVEDSIGEETGGKVEGCSDDTEDD